MKIVPVLLNCFPYSAPGLNDGVYLCDYSALARFFKSSEIMVKSASTGKGVEEFATGMRLWAGESATAHDLERGLTKAATMAHATARLPAFKGRYDKIYIERLPRNTTGKVRKGMLRDSQSRPGGPVEADGSPEAGREQDLLGQEGKARVADDARDEHCTQGLPQFQRKVAVTDVDGGHLHGGEVEVAADLGVGGLEERFLG